MPLGRGICMLADFRLGVGVSGWTLFSSSESLLISFSLAAALIFFSISAFSASAFLSAAEDNKNSEHTYQQSTHTNLSFQPLAGKDRPGCLPCQR